MCSSDLHDHSDTGLEVHHGVVGERLEAFEGEGLEEHGDLTLVHRGRSDPSNARRFRVSALADTTPTTGAAADRSARHDSASARQTALAGAAVHPMIVLIRTRVTHQVDVLGVGEGRSASVDRLVQHVVNRFEESPPLDRRHANCRAPRIDAGAVKYLVAVDVSDARDQMLIEKGGLHRSCGRRQESCESSPIEPLGDRVGSESCEFGNHDVGHRTLVHDDLTECSWVDETQLFIAIEGQSDMTVVRSRPTHRIDQHLTTHAEMDHHLVARIEVDQQILPPSTRRDRGDTREASDHLLATRSTHRPFSANVDRAHPTTDESGLESPSNRLDLGKFRHGSCRCPAR